MTELVMIVNDTIFVTLPFYALKVTSRKGKAATVIGWAFAAREKNTRYEKITPKHSFLFSRPMAWGLDEFQS
ncbi:MAG: hypothetical protein RRC34_07370 [Lentisphaeria bacterium]|nr:hypothetical protein [Lentisphaeria bacterium]